MSWLKPENIPHNNYAPDEIVESMVREHGELSRFILELFNEADPLHVFYGNNTDEYLGYVERFFRQLAGRDLQTLSDEEVSMLVRNSFHASQIKKGFADPKDLDELVQRICALRQKKQERV